MRRRRWYGVMFGVFALVAMGAVTGSKADSLEPLAYDSAADALYAVIGRWTDGRGGGFGWKGPWHLVRQGNAGHFLGQTRVGEVASPAWGLWANSGGLSEARRSFGRAPEAGDRVRFAFRHHEVQAGGSVGVSLHNGFGETLFALQVAGDEEGYLIRDGEGLRPSGILPRESVLEAVFLLTSETDYHFSLSDQSWTGTLYPGRETVIRQIRFWNRDAGPGSRHDLLVMDLAHLAAPQSVAPRIIRNPYERVDWEQAERHKAGLHIHTRLSDGGGEPGEVIDRYAALGYTILSLTDHDTMGRDGNVNDPRRAETTWPWQAYGRFPEAMGMVAIEGNEISRVHHIGSYYNDYGDARVGCERTAIEQIGARKGLAVMFHPGRYSRSAMWYKQLFRDYPHLIGVEIYNQDDCHPQDRALWDELLTGLSRERDLWGFANDDMHCMETQVGLGWNLFLLEELSDRHVREAMEAGQFLYVFAPEGHRGPEPPFVEAIEVEADAGILRVLASGHDRIEWISEGRVIHEGASLDLDKAEQVGGYVRAVVHCAHSDAVVGTQPFRLH